MHWRQQAVELQLEDVPADETYLGLIDILYLIYQLISSFQQISLSKYETTPRNYSIQVVDVGKAFIEALGALINVKFIRCFFGSK